MRQFILLLGLAVFPSVEAPAESTRPVEGIRQSRDRAHALVGCQIIVDADRRIDNGTIVFRDGVITAVGPNVQPPADARVWSMPGRTVFPGLIDGYSTVGKAPEITGGAPHWNVLVAPQRDVANYYRADDSFDKKLRSQGITYRLVAPGAGIVRGVSAVIASDSPSEQSGILQSNVAQHLRLTIGRQGRENYPNSPMGAVALARQAFFDAEWYSQAWRAFSADQRIGQPERNDALAALQPDVATNRLVIIETDDEQYFLRADAFAREFGLRAAMVGSGDEYRRLEAVQATNRTVILPVNFPKAPAVRTPEAIHEVSLERLMHWDLAPENPARLYEKGIDILITSKGLDDVTKLRSQVRVAIARGLPASEALRAMTANAAKLYGIDDRVGSLEVGKLASFLVTDGELFDKETKILETWIEGRRHEVEAPPSTNRDGPWKGSTRTAGRKLSFTFELSDSDKKPKGVLIVEEENQETTKVELKHLVLTDDRISFVFDTAKYGTTGAASISGVVSPMGAETVLIGNLVWPDGTRSPIVLTHSAKTSVDSQAKPSAKVSNELDKSNEGDAQTTPSAATTASEGSEDLKEDENERTLPASFPVNYPLGAFGRDEPPTQPDWVAFQGGTIWTCGNLGTIKQGTLLVHRGKIVGVGADLEIPKSALIVDARGQHLTPGIIDCHSHMATDGGVNESSQAVTAEVRIGDFIDATDMNIYRQLAGGVTTSNILHGSANPIGGQNQVIKLRWGSLPDALKFSEAPEGIKFALGENVKQSNWGDEYTTRYPQTRMGVEQIMRDRLHAASAYARRWKQWQTSRTGMPPRRDLELEALSEILNRRRWIHCHSYRQDEILALLNTLEQFDVTIGTLQHILEGYKVADAMVRHGAMGSAFSDWWAYKFEVYDAIPYNGALMHNAGIVVSFNSDDRELARHLNQEAAKAVKYGGVPADDALRFVTRNPALQLRIDQYVGSLEVGKHADIVLWSGPPLSNFSRCEQTWIDGRKYFDRRDDQDTRKRVREMKAVLVQKILKSGTPTEKPGEETKKLRELWPREDLFCHRHAHGHDE